MGLKVQWEENKGHGDRKRRASRDRCLVWIRVSPSSLSARHREAGGWNNNSGVMQCALEGQNESRKEEKEEKHDNGSTQRRSRGQAVPTVLSRWLPSSITYLCMYKNNVTHFHRGKNPENLCLILQPLT